MRQRHMRKRSVTLSRAGWLWLLALVTIVLVFSTLLVLVIQANTIPGARFGCTYGPLPFGLSNIPAIEYQAEMYCGA